MLICAIQLSALLHNDTAPTCAITHGLMMQRHEVIMTLTNTVQPAPMSCQSLPSRSDLCDVMLQRHGVVMETCMLGPADSAFLQQAAHVTGGLYLRPSCPEALLQYLLVSIAT